jgi:hypothetical protein
MRGPYIVLRCVGSITPVQRIRQLLKIQPSNRVFDQVNRTGLDWSEDEQMMPPVDD